MANVLELQGINKRFGELEILRNLDLVLDEGQSLAVLGPSGAGKSTLLHVAGLMERPSSGLVRLMGKSMNDLPDADLARQRLDTIGFMFQFHYLLPDFDVLENVLMPARIGRDDLRTAETRAREILERLGLTPRIAHRPFQLSGGEQQRAALARALVRGPKLLLCDEPTGNLDEETGGKVISMIWSEVRRANVAAIVVTHNEKLAGMADRSYHLSHGQFSETRRQSNQ